MRTRMAAGVVALLAGALILPNQKLLARDCGDGSSGKASICSSKRAGIKGWIELHRPDGEVVRVKVDQIVFVMSATNTGAHERARSKIQLLNGSLDVLESIDVVTQVISSDSALPGEHDFCWTAQRAAVAGSKAEKLDLSIRCSLYPRKRT